LTRLNVTSGNERNTLARHSISISRKRGLEISVYQWPGTAGNMGAVRSINS
jgi:hypothetical protein